MAAIFVALLASCPKTARLQCCHRDARLATLESLKILNSGQDADDEYTLCKMNALAEKDTVKKHGLNVWVDGGEDGAEPKVE